MTQNTDIDNVIDNVIDNEQDNGHKYTRRALALVAGIMALALFSVPAQSFQQHGADVILDGAQALAPSSVSPPPVAGEDNCLSLLKAASEHTMPAATDHRDHRAAGQAAAMGLVFGVRFALGPKQVRQSGNSRAARFGVWEPSGNSKALAISAYRRCVNERALNALTGR